jgi:hypothetical protein
MDLLKIMGLVKLPPRLEIAVYLIKAELKNRKFMRGLEQVGFDTTFCSLDFGSLILKLIGFEIRSDETYEMYNQMLEACVDKLDQNENDESLSEISFKFYVDLESKMKDLRKSE